MTPASAPTTLPRTRTRRRRSPLQRLGRKLLQLVATILIGAMALVDKVLHEPLTWYILGAALLSRIAYALRSPG